MSRNIIFLGITSLLADVAGEMIFPILPLFLGVELGLSKVLIGLIEGIAESSSSIMKVFFGWMSDRLKQRKIFVLLGYTVAAIGKPLLAIAGSFPLALIARFFDRGGKGIRTAPRDALLAEYSAATHRGGTFGFHRTMDTLGAIVGNVLVFMLLAQQFQLRTIFWLALIPAIMAIFVLLPVKEKRSEVEHHEKVSLRRVGPLGKKFWLFTAIATVFSLGNISYAFLILRAETLGVSLALIPIFYLLFNVFQAALSWPLGRLTDRYGKLLFLIFGYSIFTLMSLGFAFSTTSDIVWLFFILYGVFYALTEGIARAAVVDLVEPQQKATALGTYFMFSGLAAFPASLIGGLLWKFNEGFGTFLYGAALGGLAAIFLLLFARYAAKNRSHVH